MKSLTEAVKRLLHIRLGSLATNLIETMGGFGYTVRRTAVDLALTTAMSGETILCTAAANLTLPAAARGLHYTCVQTADANMAVLAPASNDSLIGKNDAAGDSATFSTAGNKIGACCHVVAVETAADTYKWLVLNWSDCTLTIA